MESSEANQVEIKRHGDEQNDDDVEEEEDDVEEESAVGASQLNELKRVGDESNRLETLENVAEKDQSESLRVTSASEMHVEVEPQAQNGLSLTHREEVSGSLTVRREAHNQNGAQSSGCPPSLSEMSPTSVTQPISSALSPTHLEQKLSPLKVDNKFLTEADLRDCSDQKALTVLTSPTQGRSPIPDGFNWRKYGQKQVKSPVGSRSYYKCTHSDCCAKKIECSDHSGQVIEIVNKGIHSHDPPRKNHSTRDTRVALTPSAVSHNTVTEQPKVVKDSVPPTPLKETIEEIPAISNRKRQNSSGYNGSRDIQVKDEQYTEPEPKQRSKKSKAACPGAIIKPGKKPKFVVHAAGDVGISADGYRWRKYGQKMVKGNLHPRNYYRCTSAGCPVRKHIETAVDNTNAVIITYKGVHDHDMPVPKKRHGPPSAPLIAAAAPTSMNNSQLKKTETPQNQVTSTQWSVSKEGKLTGETVDVGGDKDKAIESARTLLSIGFEIKPC